MFSEPISSSTMDNLVSSIMAENLPIEMLLEFFYRLPADTVLEFQRVCKTWRDLLSLDKTNFAAMHFRLHTLRQHSIGSSKVSTQGLIFIITSEKSKRTYCHRLNYGEYDDDIVPQKLKLINHPLQKRWNYSLLYSASLVGSCNGLICVAEHKEGYFICNPITGEYFYLEGFDTNNYARIYCGFGYIPETNEYKVVQILYKERSGRGDIQVYTLGDGRGWRNKGVIDAWLRRGRGVFSNGALYWLCDTGKEIMVFNFSDEKYHILPLLPVMGEQTSILVSFGEWLCVSCWKNRQRLDIWTFKKTLSEKNVAANGNKNESWSWCKEFSLIFENLFGYPDCRPLAVTKNGIVLFKYDKFFVHHAEDSKFLSYDWKTSTLKTLGVWKNFDVIPHTNSFVSLKALGEKTWRERKKWSTN